MDSRLRVILTLLGATLATAASAESYLCVAEKTTGFNPMGDTGKWAQANFNSDEKYVISSVAPDDPRAKEYTTWGKIVGHMSPVNWVVMQIGNPSIHAVCTTPDLKAALTGDDSAMTTFGAMRCRGILSDYVFNLKDLRFEVLRYGGFVLSSKDSAVIQIGECSKL